jgi:glucose/arabinose dehydrogenase
MFKLRGSKVMRVLSGFVFAATLLTANGLSYRPAQAEVTGLVTHLKFDTSSVDSVGTNDFILRGTASYSTQVAPVTGSTASLFIDGGVESQALGGNPLFNGWTAGSVSFWMKIDTATAQAWANNSSHDLFFKDKVMQSRVFKDASGQLKYMVSHGNNTVFGSWITSSASLPVGTWVHVVSTHEGTNLAIYFNGQPAGNGSTGVTLASTDPNNRLEISTYDGGFAGYVDDVRFYNRAITQLEAAELAGGGGAPTTFTITASAGANGTITPSGSVVVNSGANQAFTITPNAGYQIADVTVDGVSQGAVASYTFTNVTAAHTISATFSVVSSDTTPPTGTISIDGGAASTTQTAVTLSLSATDASGVSQMRFSNDGTTFSAPVAYAASSAWTLTNGNGTKTVYAQFSDTVGNWSTAPITDTITLNAPVSTNPQLGAHVLLAQNEFAGTNPAVTPAVATSATGSSLLAISMGWLSNLSNPVDSYGNTWTQLSGPNIYFSPQFYTAVWSAANAQGGNGHTLTFAKDAYPTGEINTALIEVKNGGTVSNIFNLAPSTNQTPGTITVSGPATLIAIWAGDSAQLDHTAVPDNGFTVIDSRLDFGTGDETGVQAAIAVKEVATAGTYTVHWTSTPTQNCACYLIAVQNAVPPVTHTISASAGTNGTVSPSGSVAVVQGTNQAFTITPNAGYQIADVLVDGVSAGAVASYTFTNVTASHTISASFSLIPPTTYTITASAGANGAITPSGSVVVNSGANQAFTITPNSGYQVASVLVDGVSQGAITSYTFTNVTAAHTISASFSQIPQGSYTITATAGTGGTLSPSGSVVVSAGQTQLFTIVPTGNYQVSSVLVDGVSVGAVTSYAFSNVNANHTISASFSTPTPPEGTFQLDNAYITGLASPTAMAYAPDGRLFITEQAGAVRIVTPQGQLLPTPFLVTSNMRSDEERGLLGIAFDPNFTTNNYVYIFYTENSLGARLSRFTANGDVVVPGSEVVLLEYYNISGNHRGGDVHFGPDGKLYLALGDAGEPLESQSVTTYNGKILRLNSDGSIPSDNPTTFVNTSGQTLTTSGQYRAIWAMGLRNPYRFSFHATTGKMHINDVGAGLWEEVNVGQAGKNYGWPTCEGLCSNTNAENPIYVHERGVEGCAITGGAFYTGNQFPVEYRDDYFIIDYCSTWLRYLDSANNASATFPLTIPAFSVDLKTATDGSLLIAGHGAGTISRLYFVPNSTNHNPVASASASPTVGPSPLSVLFDGSASTDLDNDTLTYSWVFGDGATGTGMTANHVYATGGAYTAVLTVTDGNGGTDTDSVLISVGAPPTADITLPLAGSLYTAGDTITFSGTANDPDDGVLPASAYSWMVVFHHDAHTHPHLGPLTGVTSSSFTIPTLGHTEENVFYRITLTVTDSAGLQTSVSRDVYPRKASITLSSTVPGTEVLLDGSPVMTPYTFVGVAGVQRTIGVNSPQTIGGQTYLFNSWSDSGTQSHVIATPCATTTYTVALDIQTTPTLPSPTLNWRFNNSTIESILNTTTAARGTIVYATDTAPIAGANAASIKFNGAVGTYLATNGSGILNAWPAATISTWVKITSTTANGWSNNSYHALLFKYRTLQTRIQKTSTGLKFVATHGDGSTPFGTHIFSTIAIPTDTWVNLVTVHQGTTLTMYINGQLAGSGSTGKTFGGANTDGMDIIGHGGNYSGLLDDLRLYNTAFTLAQVQQIPLQ